MSWKLSIKNFLTLKANKTTGECNSNLKKIVFIFSKIYCLSQNRKKYKRSLTIKNLFKIRKILLFTLFKNINKTLMISSVWQGHWEVYPPSLDSL